jgi:hypothetical protein
MKLDYNVVIPIQIGLLVLSLFLLLYQCTFSKSDITTMGVVNGPSSMSSYNGTADNSPSSRDCSNATKTVNAGTDIGLPGDKG